MWTMFAKKKTLKKSRVCGREKKKPPKKTRGRIGEKKRGYGPHGKETVGGGGWGGGGVGLYRDGRWSV